MHTANRRRTQRIYTAQHNRSHTVWSLFHDMPRTGRSRETERRLVAESSAAVLTSEQTGADWWLFFSPILLLCCTAVRLTPFPPSGTLCPSLQWFSPVYDCVASLLLLLLLSATVPPSTINLGLEYEPFSSFHSRSPGSLIYAHYCNGHFRIHNFQSSLSNTAFLS